MAIIKCPECGEQVSDKADQCIHCGYPLTKIKENNDYQRIVNQRQQQLFKNLTNTTCNINGNIVDFSKAVQAMKQWNKKESIQYILESIDNSGIDICVDNKMTLLTHIIQQYSVPESYNAMTKEEYADDLDNMDGSIVICYLHYHKYDFEDTARNLYFKKKLTKQDFNYIKELSILTEEEKQQLISVLQLSNEVPLSFPESWDDVLYHNGIKEAEKFFDQHYKKVHKKKKKKNKQHSNNKPKQTIQQPNVPHCPTCGSTNIEKISMTRKAVGFLAVGFLSSSARNTYRCKNCGYKW